MEKNKNRFTCNQARQIDMVDYLTSLGFESKKINNDNYWYLSPLRNEKTPSFKVNRKLNRWYDHGIGKGGNIIDFAVLFHTCTIEEFLQGLEGVMYPHQKSTIPGEISARDYIEIVRELPLCSNTLLSYCKQRNIPAEIATQFCSEVYYKLKEKTFYAIGFKNDCGGYELRNSFHKSCCSPKGITTIKSSAVKVAVFEGFFDFLSFQFLFQKQEASNWNFCILNSLSFFQTARPFMEQHKTIHLYLDNDVAGKNCCRKALQSSPKYRDESLLYKNFKDLNEWIVGIGK